VGAASFMSLFMAPHSLTMAATVEVLPHPGPPVRMRTGAVVASFTASRCPLDSFCPAGVQKVSRRFFAGPVIEH